MLTREIDAKEAEKIPDECKQIGIKAKNCFYGRVGAGTLKCIVRFDCYRK